MAFCYEFIQVVCIENLNITSELFVQRFTKARSVWQSAFTFETTSTHSVIVMTRFDVETIAYNVISSGTSAVLPG